MNKNSLYVLLLALIWSVQMNAQTITGYEYWFDADYANRSYVSLSSNATVTINESISTSNLPMGHHTFWFHTKSSDGKWSIPVSSPFVKGNNPIVGLEYWYDNDYTTKSFFDLEPSAGGNFPVGLPISNLSIGDHLISICMVDEENIRSIPISSTFYFDGSVGVQPIIHLEELALYPNPTVDRLQINGLENYDRIMIINAAGQIVMNEATNQSNEALSVVHLAPGLYSIRLLNDAENVSLSFLKK